MKRRVFLKSTVGSMAIAAKPSLLRAQTITARQYHPQPENSHLQIYLTRIWDAVREETSGRLDVTVYPQNNGVAIGEPDLLRSLQAGELEFFVLNGNILSAAHPVADIQGIPFAYSSAEQATDLWDGELGRFLAEELALRGVRLIPFGGMENGVKQIVSRQKPISSPADLEGFRMRVPGGDLFVDFYNALGAEPQVINFNRLSAALNDGIIDGFENPLVVVEENRFFETCNYIALSNHQWAGYNMIANESMWQSLTEDMRDSIMRNAQRFVPEQRAFVRAANDEYNRVLRERGMVFNTPDLLSFRERLRQENFYVRWRENVGERAWTMMEAATGPVG